MAFSVGQTIGEYRIIEVIGSGGMGTVYKVRHLISDRTEAMKAILPSLIDSPELAERFVREIKLHARLNHPNIAALHNALRIDGQFLMIMEYIEGTTLYNVLKRSRIDLPESVDIACQVLNALAYAHTQGVIHRDIKPANIMLAGRSVKLMDFGIARTLAEDKDLTRTGAAIGSVHYMSPEQVRGGGVDHRSDIYSLGIVLYEMVTGEKPITGDTSWAVMNGHVNQVPRDPQAINTAIPPSLSLAILKALEKNPSDRYQNAAEFSSILQAIRIRHLVPAVTPIDLTTPAAPLATPVPERPSAPHVIPTPVPGVGPSTPAPVTFDAAELNRLKRELGVYVGAMARIIVDRAAKKATSWDQLYKSLSAEIPEGEERRRFLANRQR